MHEMSLIQSVLDIIAEYAEKQRFRKVASITLSFGKASTVATTSISFAFDVLSKNTIAEGAELKFDIKPVVIYCLACEKDIIVNTCEAICPDCGGNEVFLAGGTEELKFVEMDVE